VHATLDMPGNVWLDLVLAAAGLLVSLWLSWISGRSEGRARWYWLTPAVLILAAMAVASMPFVHLNGADTDTTEAGTDLRFEAVTNVLECQVYLGTGHIPDDHNLLLFDRATNGNGGPLDAWTVTNATASNKERGGWQTTTVHLGAQHVEVTAVVVTDGLYRSFSSIHEPRKLDNLPPGFALPSLHLDVTLQSLTDPAGCRK
jgi:hypothetical protein